MDLKEGEEICPSCKGTGSNQDREGHTPFEFVCYWCRGAGKIDWVQKAMGPRPINPYDTLTLPLLRHAYPKLIAEDLISVTPMEAPELVKGFKKDGT